LDRRLRNGEYAVAEALGDVHERILDAAVVDQRIAAVDRSRMLRGALGEAAEADLLYGRRRSVEANLAGDGAGRRRIQRRRLACGSGGRRVDTAARDADQQQRDESERAAHAPAVCNASAWVNASGAAACRGGEPFAI